MTNWIRVIFVAIADSFSDQEDEYIMAEENDHQANDGIDQEDIRNLHIDGKFKLNSIEKRQVD